MKVTTISKDNDYGNTKQLYINLLPHNIYRWGGFYACDVLHCGNGQGERAEE